MPPKRVNPRRIKIHHVYTFDEVARVLGVHKNTVRAWHRDGLSVITDRRPYLVTGRDLRCYLDRKRDVRKVRCAPGTIYCLKCRAPRAPAMGMVDYRPKNSTTGNLIALCTECSTTMYRCTRKTEIGHIMPGIEVSFTEPEPSIDGCSSHSLNCDKEEDR